MGIRSGEPERGGMNRPDQADSAGMSPAQFPTLIHVWIAALFAAILLRTFLMPLPPYDVWWQLAMGRLIVQRATRDGGLIPSSLTGSTILAPPRRTQSIYQARDGVRLYFNQSSTTVRVRWC